MNGTSVLLKDDEMNKSLSSISRMSSDNHSAQREDSLGSRILESEISSSESSYEDDNDRNKKRRRRHTQKVAKRLRKMKNQEGSKTEINQEKIELQKQLEFNRMKKIYDDEECLKVEKQTLRDVKCAARDYLVRHVKFVDTGKKKGFPTYFKHDFTDKDHFITKFVDECCGLRMKSLEEKAVFWNTYAKYVKKEFANHRSAMTAAMKYDFLNGKSLNSYVYKQTLLKSDKFNNDFFSLSPVMSVYMRQDEKVPDAVREVIDLAVKKKIHTLRQVVEDLKGMVFFALICIKNVVRSREWRLKHKKYKFRHFATVADESLAMLVFENNITSWIRKVEESEKKASTDGTQTWRYDRDSNDASEDTENSPRTRYTDVLINNGDKIRKGWSPAGIRRYNEIFEKIREQRSDCRYNRMEEELVDFWRDTAMNENRTQGLDDDDNNEDMEELVEAHNDFEMDPTIEII